MRYTEARLLPIADLLLSELGEDAVDFRDNYDGTMQEPVELPARLPIVLLNGASGIAVGLSTDIPSHNLREVSNAAIAIVANPTISDADIYEILRAPDFATGAQIITSLDTIRQIYMNGRGTLRVRSRWEIEQLAKGDWRIVITELPPNVSTSMVLAEIEHLVNPNPGNGAGEKRKRGGGESSPMKAAILSLIDGIRDESGKDASVRLVIEPKTRRVDPDAVMKLLLAHTSLESNVSVNFTVIDTEGNAQCMPVATILRSWVDFRLVTIRRRSQFRLANLDRRIHILEGRQIVLLNIDDVIHTIRNADDPKPALQIRFALSDVQAEDILDMPLRRLARLAGIEIERELDQRRGERDEMVSLLGDESKLRALAVEEITADRDKYGDDRRTLLEEAEALSTSRIALPVSNDPVTVVLSKNGWVRTRSGHEVALDSLTYKNGDSYWQSFPCSTGDTLAILDSTGQIYNIPVSALPGGKGDGVPLVAQISITSNASIVDVWIIQPDTLCLVASNAGYGYLTESANLLTKMKGGKALLTLPSGASPLPISSVPSPDSELGLLSSDNRLLVIPASSVNHLPKGKGVKLIELTPGATMETAVPLPTKTLSVNDVLLEQCRGRRVSKGKVVKGGGKRQMSLDE
jgi:topoisomerase-4 subunit A